MTPGDLIVQTEGGDDLQNALPVVENLPAFDLLCSVEDLRDQRIFLFQLLRKFSGISQRHAPFLSRTVR